MKGGIVRIWCPCYSWRMFPQHTLTRFTLFAALTLAICGDCLAQSPQFRFGQGRKDRSAQQSAAAATPKKQVGLRQALIKAKGQRSRRSRTPATTSTARIQPATQNSGQNRVLGFLSRKNQPRETAQTQSRAYTAATRQTVAAAGPRLPRFATVTQFSTVFHVIDGSPEKTFPIEVTHGTVSRTHGQGERWACVELPTGLMGFIRKDRLRAATSSEISRFYNPRAPEDTSGPPLAANFEVYFRSLLSSAYRTRRTSPWVGSRHIEIDLPALPPANDDSRPLDSALWPNRSAESTRE